MTATAAAWPVMDSRWLKPAFVEVFRVLKPGRFCVRTCGWQKADGFLGAWREAGFQPLGHIMWPSCMLRSAVCRPSGTNRRILLAKSPVGRPAEILLDVLDWQYTGNVLHRTQKPVGSLKPVIESFTKPGDVALDPFRALAAGCWLPRF
jgi:adenine-specific DNA-methyltransferase